MKIISVVQAKAQFSTFLAEVEAGEEIAVTRHGKIVAKLVPERPLMAAEAFRDFWADGSLGLRAPLNRPAENVASLDK